MRCNRSPNVSHNKPTDCHYRVHDQYTIPANLDPRSRALLLITRPSRRRREVRRSYIPINSRLLIRVSFWSFILLLLCVSGFFAFVLVTHMSLIPATLVAGTWWREWALVMAGIVLFECLSVLVTWPVRRKWGSSARISRVVKVGHRWVTTTLAALIVVAICRTVLGSWV